MFFEVSCETLHPLEAATAQDADEVLTQRVSDERCVMSAENEKPCQPCEEESSKHKPKSPHKQVNSSRILTWSMAETPCPDHFSSSAERDYKSKDSLIGNKILFDLLIGW